MAQGYVTGCSHLWVGFLTAGKQPLQVAQQGGLPPTSGGSPGLVGGPPPAEPYPVVIANPYDPSSGSRLAYYLGSATETPRIQFVRGWMPWYDDEVGQSMPYDELEDGEEAIVSAVINRWNEPVYAALAKIVARFGGPPRGSWVPGDTGTSVMMEGFSYSLWLQFPFAAKGAMRFGFGGPMPAGYHFLNAYLYGPDELSPLNTAPSERTLVWRCRKYLDAVSGSSVLFDHDMTGVGVFN